MNKKGFTLIELLAVIVILAIIALIATPIIMGIINEVNEQTTKRNVEQLKKGAEAFTMSEQLLDSGYVFNLADYEYSGKRYENLAIIVNEDTEASVAVYENDKCYYILAGTTEVKVEEITKGKCLAKAGTIELTIGEITEDLLLNQTYNYMGGTYLASSQQYNNVWLSGQLFKIMGKDESGNIRLIEEGPVTAIPYDDVSSQFETSHVYDWLNDYYYNHLDEDLRSIMKMTSYCKDPTDDANAKRETCTDSGQAKVTLLSIDEWNLSNMVSKMTCEEVIETFLSPALGMTLEQILSYLKEEGYTCTQYFEENGFIVDHDNNTVMFDGSNLGYTNSYLGYYFGNILGYAFAPGNTASSLSWIYSLTPSIEDTYGWVIANNLSSVGSVNFTNVSSSLDAVALGVRPIITVSDQVVFNVGDGTYENPYRITEKVQSEKLHDVTSSGDYVMFDDDLYRVVEVNESGTKILSFSSISDFSGTYDAMLNALQDNSILNEFVDTNNQSKIVNFTWNIGQSLNSNGHYSLALSDGTNNFTAKTGGIRVGEMYAIPTNFYMQTETYWHSAPWLLTQQEESNAWLNNLDGVNLVPISTSRIFGCQHAFVIDKEVEIISGEGTFQSPYQI